MNVQTLNLDAEGEEIVVCYCVIRSCLLQSKGSLQRIKLIPIAVKMEVNITNKVASRLHYLDSKLFRMCDQGK